MPGPRSNLFRLAVLAGALAVTLAYANHWSNPFHFDDQHTVVQNPVIRQVSNIPRLLTDARAASVYATHAVYRPVTYLTLVADYALAGGLNPRFFHASTFAAYVLLLCALFVLARATLDASAPGPANRWVALGATLLFGLHPVCADTINYIIQRAEVWSALGVTASVALYGARPSWRRDGLFVLPGVLGIFAKAIASVFPLLIGIYALMLDRGPKRERWASFVVALVAGGAATAVCGFVTYSTQTFDPGAPPFWQYLWTQPWVMLRYLRSFVLPLDLSIDPGWLPLVSPVEGRAIAGYAGLLLLALAIGWLGRRRATSAIAFGLAWFVVALVPVSVFPLAEVTNDHRMFLPFIGLCVAAAGTVGVLHSRGWVPRPAVSVPAVVAVLVAAGAATWHRNVVWSGEETVWADAVTKNPANGRARMNLGVALMSRGALLEARDQFEEAARLTPDYAVLEVNLGVVKGALGRHAAAEPHFRRALLLTPQSAVPPFYYGRWLLEQERLTEAVSYLEQALKLGPDDLDARHTLMTALAAHRAYSRLREVATETIARVPGDPAAEAALRTAGAGMAELAGLRAAVRSQATPEGWLDLSLRLYNERDYAGSLDAAREAITLRPGFAEAFNNVSAAHAALGQWGEAAAAAQHALVLRPDFPLARNNLAWALSQQAAQKK